MGRTWPISIAGVGGGTIRRGPDRGSSGTSGRFAASSIRGSASVRGRSEDAPFARARRTGLSELLQLQRHAGNQAVVELLRERNGKGRHADPKDRVPPDGSSSKFLQRMIEYRKVVYDEESMPLDALETLLSRMHHDREFNPPDKEERLHRLRLVLAERRKRELKKVTPLPPQRGPRLPGTLDVEAPSAGNYSEVVAALKDWEAYARRKRKELEQALDVLEETKNSLGAAYYQPDHQEFRRTYKDLKAKVTHLDGAATEALSVGFKVESSRDDWRESEFGLLRREGRLQALVEWVGTSYIANIVADPRTIAPEGDKGPAGGGIARAVIGLTVLRARASGEAEPITLFALNNKVKGIYGGYGFKVYEKASGRAIERPGRGWKTKPGGAPFKWEWHRVSDMVLTPEAAKDFVQKRDLREVLKIPEELRGQLEELLS